MLDRIASSCLVALEQARHNGLVAAVSADQMVLANQPDVAGPRHRLGRIAHRRRCRTLSSGRRVLLHACDCGQDCGHVGPHVQAICAGIMPGTRR